ncbi:MAG: thiaminase II [Burkholderiaceae bacterium]
MKDYGSRVYPLWREAADSAWTRYTKHAFVEGLATGELPLAAFRHYLIQDYLFLMHFSRAWSLVVVKADTIDEMRHAAATVDALVNQEMQLHVSTCAGFGLSEAQLGQAQEAAANIAYTRYVLDAGYAGDLLDLLAALAPCVFGYGEIGARLKPLSGPDNPYQNWIDTYAASDYQAVCETVGQLIDESIERRLGTSPQSSPRWPRLCDRFRQATELEVNFWQMGLDGPADG